MRGKLIVFEGPDGSGKTTQAQLLAEYLQEQQGIACCYAKQPGHAFDGQLRELILSKTATPLAELFLFLADRHQHVIETLKPLLDSGSWVVLDRYSDSTVGYQWYGRSSYAFKAAFDHDLPHFLRVVAMAQADLEPDLVLVLDAPEPVLNKRLHQRAETTRLGEAGGAEFRKNLRTYYQHVMPYIRRYHIAAISADGPVNEIHQHVIDAVLTHTKLKPLTSSDEPE